jgi:hypothetical protein
MGEKPPCYFLPRLASALAIFAPRGAAFALRRRPKGSESSFFSIACYFLFSRTDFGANMVLLDLQNARSVAAENFVSAIFISGM